MYQSSRSKYKCDNNMCVIIVCRFLHNQRLLSDNQGTAPTENSHETRSVL